MSEKPQITAFRPYATGAESKRSLGLGDRIEKLVKPIARAMKSKCLDETEKLKSGSPCAKKRDTLNKVGRAIGIGV